MNRSRRQFFSKLLQPARNAANGTTPARAPSPVDYGSLAGDLPPELLAMEAERLGLDPEADRDKLMAALHDAMLPDGPKRMEPNGAS